MPGTAGAPAGSSPNSGAGSTGSGSSSSGSSPSTGTTTGQPCPPTAGSGPTAK
jgi:hypothetical protein